MESFSSLARYSVNIERKAICFVVASEITVTAFLADQIRSLMSRYQVCVVLNTNNPQFLVPLGIHVEVISVPIDRKIRLPSDLSALIALWRLFRSRRFDLVHSVSPKAGLLAMLSGFIARVPRRVHTFTGQVWVTRSGIVRKILKWIDKLLATLATHILVDSPSQRSFLLAEGVVRADKSVVLSGGSIGGVDLQRFRPNLEARGAVRMELNIEPTVPLLLFVGRLKRDKGVLDLARTYAMLEGVAVRSVLLIVGPDEEKLRGRMEELAEGRQHGLKFLPYTGNPERYMAAADVLCLPSYREGFGSVIIEAAACGVPAVGSRIYGISDAIVDGQTGLLHEPGDVNEMRRCLQRLIEDPESRIRMGRAARARAIEVFPKEQLTAGLLTFYHELLN